MLVYVNCLSLLSFAAYLDNIEIGFKSGQSLDFSRLLICSFNWVRLKYWPCCSAGYLTLYLFHSFQAALLDLLAVSNLKSSQFNHHLEKSILSSQNQINSHPQTQQFYFAQAINIKVLIAMILARRESQLKGMSFDQKLMSSQHLIKVIEYQDPFNFVQTLFGYALGSINTALNEKFIFELKKKFSMIQELFFNKALDNEAISLIVIDGIETYKKVQGINQKQETMLIVLSQDIEQSMMSPDYITQKWKRQALIEEENRRNQLAFKKFLEQQSLQLKRKAEEMQAQGWQCQVCLTQIDRNNFGLLQCSHIFHPQCITAYLKTKIEASELDIKCPMQGCGRHLEVGDIYQYADADLKQKFQKFSFNKFIEQNNSSTAWCPTAGCSAAFEFDQALDNYKCPACHNHYCLKCKCKYHYGMTCAQYRINNSFDKNDEDFIKFVRGAKFKQCPKCNYWVQRAEGCSTMTCKCGQEFCYNCGGTTCPHGMCSNAPQGSIPRPRPVPMLPARHPRPNRKK